MLTPYQFASNRPIDGIDMDGGEHLAVSIWLEKKVFGTNHIEKVRDGFIDAGKEYVVSTIHSLPLIKQQVADYFKNTSRFATADPKVVEKQLQYQQQMILESGKAAWATIKGYGELLRGAAKGNEKAIGAAAFEAAMFFVPGGEELKSLTFETKELKALGESIEVAKKVIRNSEGLPVDRFLVKNEDDLLKVAEDAAGGSLDNFEQIKSNRWMGEVNGESFKIEWEPFGHASTNEGPHVRIQKGYYTEKGKLKWDNGEKYFIQGQEKLFNKVKK